MISTETIEITAYRDDDGRPTCCLHIPVAMCKFLRFRKFGNKPYCCYTDEDLLDYIPRGYLRPTVLCPVWPYKE